MFGTILVLYLRFICKNKKRNFNPKIFRIVKSCIQRIIVIQCDLNIIFNNILSIYHKLYINN
jgi:hypothetical protein